MKVSLETNGKEITVDHASLNLHRDLHCEMAFLHLKVGSAELSISFDSWDEMIRFCEKHNFPYTDNRPKEATHATHSSTI